ncbi:hypothetical protein PU634_02365 [Oceanimonas pelagia]|uniref:Uncharacterized protein n=1 Tax=Oceanimonas pelagia TaxID=3028314 RepID=A0AA50QAN6_9GAMM|nr:hypothetical protein [Oceanimonas pelagia]WMC11228.1 hypothetical protein PU634_02365 [Oceanimonas pelagia]
MQKLVTAEWYGFTITVIKHNTGIVTGYQQLTGEKSVSRHKLTHGTIGCLRRHSPTDIRYHRNWNTHALFDPCLVNFLLMASSLNDRHKKIGLKYRGMFLLGALIWDDMSPDVNFSIWRSLRVLAPSDT